jgi:hypothetical protein
LFKDTDFSTIENWMLSPKTMPQKAGQLKVGVTSPASQMIAVEPGRRYRNSVTALCADQPSQGRVQVNWINKKGKFIKTDIEVFDCTMTESTNTMHVTAPRDASKAVVFATGHTDIPIIIRKVSFKQ